MREEQEERHTLLVLLVQRSMPAAYQQLVKHVSSRERVCVGLWLTLSGTLILASAPCRT